MEERHHPSKTVAMIAGFAAGIISRTTTAPLDRLKILAQGSHATHRVSDLEVMRLNCMSVYRTEGIRAFWRGNGINCLKAGPELAITFGLREAIVQRIGKFRNSDDLTFLDNCIAGATAGVVAQVTLYPLELIKTRVTISSRGETKGPWDCLVTTVRGRGFLDLYTGMCANLIGIFPYRGMEMGIFFTLQNRLANFQDSAIGLEQTALIGFVASLVAQLLTFPLNVARTKLQSQGINGRPVLYRGLAHCLSDLVRQRGISGLYAGVVPNICKAVPASVLSFVTYNSLIEAL